MNIFQALDTKISHFSNVQPMVNIWLIGGYDIPPVYYPKMKCNHNPMFEYVEQVLPVYYPYM